MAPSPTHLHKLTSENSGLLGCNAASLGTRFSMFWTWRITHTAIQCHIIGDWQPDNNAVKTMTKINTDWSF